MNRSSKMFLSFLLLFSLFGSVVSPIINAFSGGEELCKERFPNYARDSSSIAITKNSTSNPKDLRYFNLSHHAKTMFSSE